MSYIQVKPTPALGKVFKNVVFEKYGLGKGVMKQALEDAMLEFVIKYGSEQDVAVAKGLIEDRGKVGSKS